MSAVTAILGVLVVAAIAAVLLKTQRPELGLSVTVLTCVLILSVLILRLTPLLKTVENLFSGLPVSWEYGSILLKGLGICLLTQTAADTCRDAGETALAGKAELTGKITLLALSVPLFQEVATLAVAMINGEGVGG